MPAVPPHKLSSYSKSSDDLDTLALLDAAESRARASLHLAEEASARVEALEAALAKVRDDTQNVDDAQRISVVDTATLIAMAKGVPSQPANKPVSFSPQALTIRGRHWKFTVPIALLIGLVPMVWALVGDYLQLKRDLKVQSDAFGAVSKRNEEVDQRVSRLSESLSSLRETVAEQSGYIAAVLPNAGVKVPGAAPGSIPITVVADPLPLGTKRQLPVTTHTLVPAPKTP